MNEVERKALKAANRITAQTRPLRRFWTCACGYKTIAVSKQICQRCQSEMKPDRPI
jgi:hypothetical protein